MRERLCGRSATLCGELDPELEIAVALEVGRAEEKARIRAILESEIALGRRRYAEVVAFETDIPADTAMHLLSAMPIEQPASGALQRLFWRGQW